MKMLGLNVLVTESEAPTQTAGGIILSGAEIDKASKPGIVLSMSLDVANQGNLEVGQEIYLKWSEAMPVTIEGKKAAILHVDHIKAIIK
jgi:co-chaperonin GroES (HSP10)|tara:strand:+ start:1360 stop:1626 length:267 start_codon:yes stop_codon:yes gene_type:complete